MNTDFLMRIASLYPYAGGEEEAIAQIEEFFSPFARRLADDMLTYPAYALGNENGGPAIAIIAQLDEPGFLLREHLEKGFVGFEAYGEIDSRALTAQEVYLFCEKRYFGLIGNKPSHYLTQEDKTAKVDISKLFIDTGLDPDHMKELLPPGCFIGLKAEPRRLQETAVAGHGLGCKVGCVAMLECLRGLSGREIAQKVYFLIAGKSAKGRGELARALERYQVEKVVLIDSVPSNRRADDPERTCPGEGAALIYGGSIDFALTEDIRKTALAAGVPVQSGFCNFDENGTLALIYSAGSGHPCAGLSIPVENRGMAYEIAYIDDIAQAGSLAANWLLKGVRHG